jgi:hypothetical protein
LSVGKDVETSLAIANYGSVVFIAIDANILHVINIADKTLNTIGFISQIASISCRFVPPHAPPSF